mmetsp:Transcript_36658/g.85294  ORF Transcript_36658/g.85294 Transcript_36658/m.85294 type:complete len:341 (+) Transcript_36658:73-1095(+)
MLPFLDLNAGCLLEHCAVDSFHHGLQLLHRPHLIKLADARLDHCFDGGLPQNGHRPLVDDQRDDGVWGSARIHRASRAVHVHVAFWWAHPCSQPFESLGSPCSGWCHERCVESARARDELGLERTVCLHKLLKFLHGRLGATASGTLGKQRSGHLAHSARPHFVSHLFAETFKLVTLDACDGEQRLCFTFGGGLRQGLCTDLCKLQAITKRENTSCHECRQFTHAETCNGSRPSRHLWRLLLQLLQACKTCNKHHRIAELGFLKLGTWPIEANIKHIPAKDFFRRAEYVLHCNNVPDIGHHLHVLRTLTRKQQARSGRVFRKVEEVWPAYAAELVGHCLH